MVGLCGAVAAGSVEPTIDALDREPWYETEQLRTDDGALGVVHHGEKDPGGHAVWRGEDGVGALFGAVSTASGSDLDDLFAAFLDRPTEVLPTLDGPFLLAGLDERDGSVTVATDKLATRPCYYAERDGGFAFCSSLGGLLATADGVDLDERAAADLLSFGFVLGRKTLARSATALGPASVATYDGELSVERYWEPEFGRSPVRGYPERTLDLYRESVANVAESMEGEVALWLSGGLDSRTMAAVLREEYGPFRTLTYDSNPSDGSNIGPARRVADLLGVDNEVVSIDPGDFESVLREAVSVTDGMVTWFHFHNPAFVLDELHERADLVMEGAPQGELLGDVIAPAHVANASSAADALSRAVSSVPAEQVRRLSTVPVDPEESLRTAAARSDQPGVAHAAVDAWIHTVAPNAHFRGNRLFRSQVGMRLPFPHGALLDHLAKMPIRAFRRGTVPFTDGSIPRAMAPLKRDVVLALDSGLEDVPYERTNLPPKRPLWMHDLGYVAKQARLRYVTRRRKHWTKWYRDDHRVRSAVNDWLDSACARPLFDEREVRQLQGEHLAGEANHMNVLANLTTLELWLQEHVDAS